MLKQIAPVTDVTFKRLYITVCGRRILIFVRQPDQNIIVESAMNELRRKRSETKLKWLLSGAIVNSGTPVEGRDNASAQRLISPGKTRVGEHSSVANVHNQYAIKDYVTERVYPAGIPDAISRDSRACPSLGKSFQMKDMKTILLILCATAFITCAGFAQRNNKCLFGIKGGANFSSVYDPEGPAFEASPKFGFAAGIFTGISVGEYMGFQSEVLFSQRRFKATGEMSGMPYTLTRTASYIDVPVFFTLAPTESLTILAGPQYSYLLAQKDVFRNTALSVDQERELRDDNARKGVLSFTGGGDVNLYHFVIGVRVGWNILNNSKSGSTTTLRYKNVWYQTTIGYRFY